METFEGRFFCLFFGIIGIPLMLSVLADVGGIFAGILQLAWDKNKTRLTLIARKLHLLKPGYDLQCKFQCFNIQQMQVRKNYRAVRTRRSQILSVWSATS